MHEKGSIKMTKIA